MMKFWFWIGVLILCISVTGGAIAGQYIAYETGMFDAYHRVDAFVISGFIGGIIGLKEFLNWIRGGY